MDTKQVVSALEWSIAQEMTNLAIILFVIARSLWQLNSTMDKHHSQKRHRLELNGPHV